MEGPWNYMGRGNNIMRSDLKWIFWLRMSLYGNFHAQNQSYEYTHDILLYTTKVNFSFAATRTKTFPSLNGLRNPGMRSDR